MTIDLFIPCFIDQFYPETGHNVVKILKKLGLEINYNSNQTCCGQPSFNSGYWKETLPIAKKFIKDFPNDRPIVSPSASCTGFVKNYYPELSKEADFLSEHGRLKRNLFELTDFLVNYLKVDDLGAEFNAKVTYHDACTALREYGIKKEPRQLLSKVKGLELIEMNESDVCCGFGGTFSVKMEPISIAMVEQKVENALATGAEYIVSTEASCLMNIEGYIKRNNLPIKAIHIADILASGW
ncbi:MAG: (Fe-S)-binding protein [Bacteroidales bacterium]|nr:(Fe-S)-binding protein [Bacteroidales bacterium]MBN2757355.1 (Fe-S)-binding protein [Bacteroidales bacterium]